MKSVQNLCPLPEVDFSIELIHCWMVDYWGRDSPEFPVKFVQPFDEGFSLYKSFKNSFGNLYFTGLKLDVTNSRRWRESANHCDNCQIDLNCYGIIV